MTRNEGPACFGLGLFVDLGLFRLKSKDLTRVITSLSIVLFFHCLPCNIHSSVVVFVYSCIHFTVSAHYLCMAISIEMGNKKTFLNVTY